MAILETLAVRCGITNPTANVTSNGFSSGNNNLPIPTDAEPTGDGIIEFAGKEGHESSSGLKLFPYGVGSDSATFLMNVFGWHMLPAAGAGGAIGNRDLWIPVLLASFSTITLDSALPGIATTTLGTTQYFASAITLVTGNSGISEEIVSPGHAAHQIASITLDSKGAKKIGVYFSTGGSATSCNCLFCKM